MFTVRAQQTKAVGESWWDREVKGDDLPSTRKIPENSEFKICIIMHKICILILCIFLKMPKNHFSGHFR